MAKDAGGHGSEARGGGQLTDPLTRMKDIMHGVGNSPAHGTGVAQIGGPWRLNSHTHEIVSPTGDVAARMRVGQMNGLALDTPGSVGISRSGGTALHDTIAMAGYKKDSYPADHISGALHYLTGTDFAGHTVRRVK